MDMRNLEQLKDFAAFLENPEKYRSIVNDAQKVLVELKEAAGIYKSVEEVKAWRNKLNVQYKDAEDELSKANAKLDERKVKMAETHAEKEAGYVRKVVQLDAHEKELVEREKRLLDAEKLQAVLEAKNKELETQLEQVYQARVALKTKEDALKAVLR